MRLVRFEILKKFSKSTNVETIDYISRKKNCEQGVPKCLVAYGDMLKLILEIVMTLDTCYLLTTVLPYSL